MTHTWPAVLGTLLREGTLSREAAAWVMGEIMSGSATNAQTAGFAVAMRAAGESPEAIAGLVDTMLANAAPAHAPAGCVDIVGTGGDQAHTVNISTMSAIVAAAAGVRIAKHGARAASSQCGAADVLEELGINLTLDGDGVAACIEQVGIGFFFAPHFHAGLRFAGPARKELGIPTVFNFLGPLSNPARPDGLAVGCADPRMAPIMADAMRMRGVNAVVFRGDDGLDELTTTTTSQVWLVPRDGSQVHVHQFDPQQFGITPATPEQLRGGDRAFNAAVVHEVLGGADHPAREAVVLNAASAIVVHGGVPANGSDFDDAMRDALRDAAAAIDSGGGADVLRRWVAQSNA